jgi:hypothetical protein
MAERPPEDAISEALAAPDDSEERWERVTALHRAGDEATFQAIAALLDSDDVRKRVLAADVLAQFGCGLPAEDRPYKTLAADLLLSRLVVERDPRALARSQRPSVISTTTARCLSSSSWPDMKTPQCGSVRRSRSWGWRTRRRSKP